MKQLIWLFLSVAFTAGIWVGAYMQYSSEGEFKEMCRAVVEALSQPEPDPSLPKQSSRPMQI